MITSDKDNKGKEGVSWIYDTPSFFSSFVVFGHADFADDADFSSWEGFVPQISQIYTDFSSWDYFCHADFADDADFSSWDYFVPQISQMTQIFLRGIILSHRFRK